MAVAKRFQRKVLAGSASLRYDTLCLSLLYFYEFSHDVLVVFPLFGVVELSTKLGVGIALVFDSPLYLASNHTQELKEPFFGQQSFVVLDRQICHFYLLC